MILALVTEPGATDSMLVDPVIRYAFYNGPILTVHPDYRACGAVPLVVGEFVAAPLVCTEPTYIYILIAAAPARGVQQYRLVILEASHVSDLLALARQVP